MSEQEGSKKNKTLFFICFIAGFIDVKHSADFAALETDTLFLSPALPVSFLSTYYAL